MGWPTKGTRLSDGNWVVFLENLARLLKSLHIRKEVRTDGSVADVRCHRCGTLLGFGRMLYSLNPNDAARISTGPAGILDRLRQQLGQGFGDTNTFCRRCGTHSVGVTGLAVSGSPRARYEDVDGRIDLTRLLAAASSVTYGLNGRPLGLALQDLDWNARGIRHAIDLRIL